MIIDVIDTFANRNQESYNANVETNHLQDVIPLHNYRTTEKCWSKEYSIEQSQLYKILLRSCIAS